MNQSNSKNNLIEIYLLLAMDIVAICISYVLAYYMRYSDSSMVFSNAHKLVLMSIVLACVIYSIFLEWNRDFVNRGYFVEFIAITKYNIVLLVIAALIVFLFRQGEFYSRLVFVFFAVCNEILMIIMHSIAKRIMRGYLTSEHSRVPVMVIANHADCETVLDRLHSSLPVNYDITAMTIWDKDMVGSKIDDIDVVAKRENIFEIIRGLPLDEVFINLPDASLNTLRELIRAIESMGAICHYNLDVSDWNEKESTLGSFGNFTVLSYAINRVDPKRLMIKRLMDILGACIGLLITIVLTPFIALCIKLDSPGPVFFVQTRIGKNGRRFNFYKFRSMYTDAEERKKELMEDNEVDGLMFKIKDDPRITRIGRVLRKTSLDELPQFYNILIGEMSLVGTRPPTEDEFESYSLYYRRRLCMTPGLTGLWQVSGRSDISDFDEVVKLDLEYIDNWSLTLDIKILLQTVGTVLFRRGAK